MKFSMNFNHVHTFGKVGKMSQQANYFKLPSDIKISYQHECILISDTGNKRIQVFNLKTREYTLSIYLKARPQHLCIEDNYNGKGDQAFYFSCGDTSCIFKFDLENTLKKALQLEQDVNITNNGKQIIDYIWKSQKLNNPQGITIDYRNDNNLVYVGELGTGRMRILNSINGNDLQSSEFRYKCRPYYVNIFNQGKNLLVSEPIFEDRIQLFERINHLPSNNGSNSINGNNSNNNNIENLEEWKSIIKIGRKGSGELEFQNPYGIICDEESQHLIICDSFNNRIVILNQEGTLVKIFGKKGQANDEFNTPNGLCLDYKTGELYICDFANQRVLIFN